jgi:hypothetical protein
MQYRALCRGVRFFFTHTHMPNIGKFGEKLICLKPPFAQVLVLLTNSGMMNWRKRRLNV